MKFPKPQYDKILTTVKSNGFSAEEFFFVKRKGWVRIEHLKSNQFFTYFKKKETHINKDSGRWENKMYFKIKMSENQDCTKPTFDSMMEMFDVWIKKLM